MSKRLAILAATSALALSMPAAAQVDDRYAGVDEVIETYSEPVVQELPEWYNGPENAGLGYGADYAVEGDYPVADLPQGRGRMGGHHGGPHHGMAPAGPPQLAYSPAERAEWLGQCRALRAQEQQVVYADDRRNHDGGILGGVVGAVAGGVIGHEVRNRHRLVGTLLGAGIGGIAGAVLGSVIDSATDHDHGDRDVAQPEEPGFDYCEAYLLNYERGYGTPQMAYAPVMMVPVAQAPMMQQRHTARRVIVEEEVEVEAEAPHHRRHHRQPEGDKRIPLN